MAEWLRHFGQRPKTPTISAPTEEEADYFSSSPAKTTHSSPTRRLNRAPAVRRIASQLSLASLPTSEHSFIPPALPDPSDASFKTTHSNDSASSKPILPNEHNLTLDSSPKKTNAVRPSEPQEPFIVREADRVWHAPTPEQMIETLRVALMNKPSTLEPLPVQFNGHVSALLENYGKLKIEVERTKRAAREQVEKIEALRARENARYRDSSEKLLEELDKYRAEVKRLELILARHSKDGMATVVFARAESVVDRSAKTRKALEERVKRLSRGDDHDDLDVTPVSTKPKPFVPERKPSIYTRSHLVHPPNFDPDQDRRVSEQIRSEQLLKEIKKDKKKKKREKKARKEEEKNMKKAKEADEKKDKGKEKSHSHRFAPFTSKHRRHSKGKAPQDQPDATGQDEDLAQAFDTNLPTGGGHAPGRFQPHAQLAEGGQYTDFISSSSSAYMSNSSSSSSDGIFPPKVRQIVRAVGMTDRDMEENTRQSEEQSRRLPDMTSTHSRSTGQFAIEKYLEENTMVPESILRGAAMNAESSRLEAISEDYFSQKRPTDQRKRQRGFSFIVGEDDSLPVSPMALPPPMQPESEESAEETGNSLLPTYYHTSEVAGASDIRQPRPLSTHSAAGGTSVAKQLQQAVTTDSTTDIAPTVTTPGQAAGSIFAPASTTTPGSTQVRRTSTGSVIYTGNNHSAAAATAGNRDSTGSRITVLRDNSGRTASSSRRQSSHSTDLSFDSSPAMPPITEGQSYHDAGPLSPTPATRGGGKTRSGRRGRGGGSGMSSSATSSPALTSTGGDQADTRVPTTPSSPALRSRETSGIGGSETGAGAAGAGGTAAQAARIAAALAHARGQKRSASQMQRASE